MMERLIRVLVYVECELVRWSAELIFVSGDLRQIGLIVIDGHLLPRGEGL